MPRDGAIIFADLIGKLAVLRIECAKCGGRARCSLVKPHGLLTQRALFLPRSISKEVTGKLTRKRGGVCHLHCGMFSAIQSQLEHSSSFWIVIMWQRTRAGSF